jgi:tetratricopeptide (TPR) repeat protein
LIAETDLWHTDPLTLQDVPTDTQALAAGLDASPPLERVWRLRMLGRLEEAALEGEELLTTASKRFRPLLVLAQVYQRQYRWHEAARLHEEALQLSRTPGREALVREQIGRRLFDEARYTDAAAELEWARDLYRSAGRQQLIIDNCEQALNRAREMAGKFA